MGAAKKSGDAEGSPRDPSTERTADIGRLDWLQPIAALLIVLVANVWVLETLRRDVAGSTGPRTLGNLSDDWDLPDRLPWVAGAITTTAATLAAFSYAILLLVSRGPAFGRSRGIAIALLVICVVLLGWIAWQMGPIATDTMARLGSPEGIGALNWYGKWVLPTLGSSCILACAAACADIVRRCAACHDAADLHRLRDQMWSLLCLIALGLVAGVLVTLFRTRLQAGPSGAESAKRAISAVTLSYGASMTLQMLAVFVPATRSLGRCARRLALSQVELDPQMWLDKFGLRETIWSRLFRGLAVLSPLLTALAGRLVAVLA